MNGIKIPKHEFKIKEINGKQFVFDEFRKKYVVLMPEEAVRQTFLHFLTNQCNYPRSLIAVENGLKYNDRQKRSDILVYDRVGQPFLLVECKSPTVPISAKTFNQAAVYNSRIKAPYIAVTNGNQSFCCKINFETSKAEFLDEMPKLS